MNVDLLGQPSTRETRIGPLVCGGENPLLVIAGPCVVETPGMTVAIAAQLKEICQRAGVSFVFKASFDKANRTSNRSYRGAGMEHGLAVLNDVRAKLQLPVTTDIHESWQAEPASQVCEMLQIPAFLARQTDLLVAAARTGKAVNVKKGQFMSPDDMPFVVDKLESAGCRNILLTERGTFFGYGRLVNDFAGLMSMRRMGIPVAFDATHSVQMPGGTGGVTGGNRSMVAPLARCAVAAGVDAIFVETHPDPDSSPSDAANIFPLGQFAELLDSLIAINEARQSTTRAALQSANNRSK